MKAVSSVLLYFLFAVIVIGCLHSGGDPQMVALRQEWNALNMRWQKHQAELERAVMSFANDRKKFKDGIVTWEGDLKIYKKEEMSFLQKLTDEQLSLYSAYEESLRSGNSTAKNLLSSRKLTEMLTEAQKTALTRNVHEGNSLEEIRELLQKQEEDLKRKEIYVYELFKISNEFHEENQRHIAYLRRLRGDIVIEKHSIINNSLQEFQDAAKEFHDRAQQKLQHQVMTNSLRDVAEAIRGY